MSIRNACKKRKAHILSPGVGVGGRAAKLKLSPKVEKWAFCVGFYELSENKKAHFLGFGDIGWEGSSNLSTVSRIQKWAFVFFQAFLTPKNHLSEKKWDFFTLRVKHHPLSSESQIVGRRGGVFNMKVTVYIIFK